jgi:hypothetical protein
MASGRNTVIASNVTTNPTNAGAKNSKKLKGEDDIGSSDH